MKRLKTDTRFQLQVCARELAFTLAASLLALSLWSAAAPAAGLPGFSVVSPHDVPGFEPVEPAAEEASPALKSSNLPDAKKEQRQAAEAQEG